MADIRINALTGTATAAASDDYLAIDGSANGTRKILASNIAQNVSDVVLGVNGPSVKSSLDARAARQGLVFDGQNTSTATVSIPAFGTNDFTMSFWLNLASTPSTYYYIYFAAGDSCSLDIRSSLNGIVWLAGSNALSIPNGTFEVGKFAQYTVTRSGLVTSFYKNGVLVTSATAGSIANCSAGITILGYSNYQGMLSGPYAYNRALSASEVTSLFEAGVPAGADYGASGVPASNTSIVTGANSDFSSDTGYWSKSGGASITGGKLVFAGGANSYISRGSLLTVGKKYRITLTISGYTSGNISYYDGAGISSFPNSNGTYSVEVTAAGTTFYLLGSGTNAVMSVDDLFIYTIGLLLAPDAAQAGGGLAWYDTSGNAANITLPASGVSWNVPSSQKTASGWTFGGNLNVRSALGYATGVQSGTTSDSTQQFILSSSGAYNHAYIGKNGTNLGIGFSSTNGSFTEDNAITIAAATKAVTLAGNLTVSGTASVGATSGLVDSLLYLDRSTTARTSQLQFRTAGVADWQVYTAGATSPLGFYANGADRMALTQTGNLLLGTTTDNTAKFQVYATPATAGYQYGIRLSDNATTTLALGLQNVAGSSLPFVYGNSGLGFGTNGATALTLDSSQNLIAATTMRSGEYTVTGLPTGAAASRGMRAFVIDATATTYASIVAGGGSNKVPVFYNGTNWLIG